MPRAEISERKRRALSGERIRVGRWPGQPLCPPRQLLLPLLLLGSLLVLPCPLPAQQGSYGVTAGGASFPNAGFDGSVTDDRKAAGVMALSLNEAVELGLANNLGILLRREGVTSARGQRWLELSRLLPELTTGASVHHLKESLAITGISLPNMPSVTPPFNYYDARVFLSQRLFDLEAIKRDRAAGYEVIAAELSEKDAREVVVVAVGAAYLRALAGYARVETVSAQLLTAQSILDRSVEMHKAGVTPGIDELRARVEWLTRSQQLIAAQNELEKDKLTLLRLIGLPIGQQFVLSDQAPFEPLVPGSIDTLLAQALENRDDYRAAQNLLKGAEAQLSAARAERLPSLVLNADYGVTGRTLSTLEDTYHIVGSISFPLFQGGKVHGDVLQAEAQLRQRREALDDLRGRIEFDLRSALLDIEAAGKQLRAARENVTLAELALAQAQERFAAGINDNLEVVQAQESVAAAHEALVAALYQHNLAKLLLARSIGMASGFGIGGK